MPTLLYQRQIVPGILELPDGVIPPGGLALLWTIDIPNRGITPQGKISSVEELVNIGRIYRGDWLLEPSFPLDRYPRLIPIDLAADSKLIIDTVGYSVSRLSLYRYGVPDPYQLVDSQNMAVSYNPNAVNKSIGEEITTVAASESVVTVPANPNRVGGYIQNLANRSMWVKWGVSSTASPLTAALPYTEVPKGSDIAIDPNYVGVISLIWSANVRTSTNAYVHELVA
jgi:hypothetical protein